MMQYGSLFPESSLRRNRENLKGFMLKYMWILFGRVRSNFCKSCRVLLTGCGTGYVLADLYERGTPSVFAIEDGLSFSVRCYDIAVSYNEEKELFEMVIVGTYHD